jgi:hypothetical protein
MTAGQEPIAPASPAPFTPRGLRGQPTLRVLKVPYREYVRRHRVHLAGRGRGEITGRWPRAAPEMTAGALFREGPGVCAASRVLPRHDPGKQEEQEMPVLHGRSSSGKRGAILMLEKKQ